jgi:hypothetical protein
LGLVRNCAFEDAAHEWLVKDQQLMTVVREGEREKLGRMREKEVHIPFSLFLSYIFVSQLAIPLLRPGTADKFIEEDRAGMPGGLTSAIRASAEDSQSVWCEHDRLCQKLILETLFLLAKSRLVRNYYRLHKLVRESISLFASSPHLFSLLVSCSERISRDGRRTSG